MTCSVLSLELSVKALATYANLMTLQFHPGLLLQRWSLLTGCNGVAEVMPVITKTWLTGLL